jgi:hypothetical protein
LASLSRTGRECCDEGLLTLGYGDEDIAIEIRTAEGLSERLPLTEHTIFTHSHDEFAHSMRKLGS